MHFNRKRRIISFFATSFVLLTSVRPLAVRCFWAHRWIKLSPPRSAKFVRPVYLSLIKLRISMTSLWRVHSHCTRMKSKNSRLFHKVRTVGQRRARRAVLGIERHAEFFFPLCVQQQLFSAKTRHELLENYYFGGLGSRTSCRGPGFDRKKGPRHFMRSFRDLLWRHVVRVKTIWTRNKTIITYFYHSCLVSRKKALVGTIFQPLPCFSWMTEIFWWESCARARKFLSSWKNSG